MFDFLSEESSKSKLNWLRAAVLGANDGIVSIAGLVVGIAGATTDFHTIAMAGIAGLVAGALSMAAGEYISVSTQRDTERAFIAKEAEALKQNPEEELKELVQMYEDKGLSNATAKHVAKELTAKDALKAHLDVELNLDANDLTNPWHAAYASAISFTVGGLVPILVILASPATVRVPLTFIAVVLALAITGYVSAIIGSAPPRRATVRVICGGVIAMAITYVIGILFGVSVA